MIEGIYHQTEDGILQKHSRVNKLSGIGFNF